MQTPSVGLMVHVLIDPARNNGSDVAPAVITRVWEHHPDAAPGMPTGYINVRVLADSNEVPWLTSINLFAERPSVDELGGMFPEFSNPPHPGAAVAAGRDRVAFWPPRVD